MDYALQGDELTKARRLFSLLRHNWESGLEDQGWLISVDGEMTPLTETLVDSGAGADYGRILKVVAELEGRDRWQSLLPPEVSSEGGAEIHNHSMPESRVLSSSAAEMLRKILLALKTSWEHELSDQNLRLEVDGEYRLATADLLADREYGHVLQVLAALNGNEDWRQLLPLPIREVELGRKEVHDVEVGCCV